MSGPPPVVVCSGCGFTLPAHVTPDDCLVCELTQMAEVERTSCTCRTPTPDRVYIGRVLCRGCDRLVSE